MEKILKNFYRQIEMSAGLAGNITASGEIDRVLVCGMGGSGISGGILSDYIKKMPVSVCNTYSLPKYINKKTLVFISSYSGNTEEPLRTYKQAKEKGARIIIVTSGGELAKKHEKKIMLPSGIPPRCSLGFMFFSMLTVLQNSGIIPDQKKPAKETADLLREFDVSVSKRLAEKLHGKIPVIYGSDDYSSVVYRWRTQFNENSKVIALSHTFPEMNHNEINADYSNGKFECVFIRDSHDHPRIRKRMDITAKILRGHAGVNNAYVKGNSRLARIFYAIHLGDWTSYYLARLRKQDPYAVPVIENFKKLMNR